MEDRLGRKIDYLRISVTDRCNLRCVYCMPPGGVKPKPHEEILRFEEILEVAGAAVELGISRFRLTGGEPLVRKGLISFIEALSGLPGVRDISLTTNGVLLAGLAGELRRAGLRRLNISLDTMDPEKYRRLTRGGDLKLVLEGIERALELGFSPVKLNVVALRGVNEGEWVDFARLTVERPLHVRFIELMPIGAAGELIGESYASCGEVRGEIERELGELAPAVGVEGNGPAEYYRLPGAAGAIGFIHAVSEHFCGSCNRLRLTADGKLRPCLFDRREVDVKGVLRGGGSREEVKGQILKAIQLKPAGYRDVVARAGGRAMAQIGG